jgi:hypothetical protein
MSKKIAKQKFKLLLKVCIPYTLGGMAVVLGGIYLLKYLFGDSEYLIVFLFLWLALFWFIYQPMFRRQMQKALQKM